MQNNLPSVERLPLAVQDKCSFGHRVTICQWFYFFFQIARTTGSESKYGVLGTITTWWPLGGAGVGACLIPHDLSCDLIGHTHRSCNRSCGISHDHKEEAY